MSEEKLENENLENALDEGKEPKKEVISETNQDNDKKVEGPKKIENLEETDDGEQLSILKEVRDELSNAYKGAKKSSDTIEQLSKEIKAFKKSDINLNKTIESLGKELGAYKARDVQVEDARYQKRLEQLSKNFKELGQSKSIEQLSKLSKEVVGEFESITSIALAQKSEEKLDIVTVPTQAMEGKKVEETKINKNKVFNFEDVCNDLTKQQARDGADSRRALNM